MTSSSISLDEVAERLGVHYMTAYRYVRTGQLPAVKVGAEWRVDRDEVEAFRATRAVPVTATGPARRSQYPRRLEARLIEGDEPGAWAIAQGALASGMAPSALYLDVIGPAMTSIGERWARGDITVAHEHQASAVVLRLIGRLGPLFRRAGRARGSVVVGAAPDDSHGVPSALLADLLRLQNFAVSDLGANTPAESFAQTALAADRLVAVGLSATSRHTDDGIRAAITAVREVVEVPIVLGGSAIRDDAHAAAVGADHHTADSAAALALFDRLGEEATARRRSKTKGSRST